MLFVLQCYLENPLTPEVPFIEQGGYGHRPILTGILLLVEPGEYGHRPILVDILPLVEQGRHGHGPNDLW